MWTDRFEKEILDRGYKYYFNNKAELIKEKDSILEFKVNGTKEYTVVIDVYHRKSTCTCPYASDGKNCKHMVASIYEYNSNGKKISKYDSEETKRIITDTIRTYDKDISIPKLMDFLDNDISEYIDCGFNKLAFSSLVHTFTKLAHYSESYYFDSLVIIKDKIVELMKKSLENISIDSKSKLLNGFYKKIQKIESENPIVFFFYTNLDNIFITLNDEVIKILLDNIYVSEEYIIKKLFEIYSKLGRDKEKLELAKRFTDKEICYKYIIETEEKKENYDKVIEYCEKAITNCKNNAYFVNYIINITRNVDKYFDKFFENVLLKFENTHKIPFEDYKLICEKLPKYEKEKLKDYILEKSLKFGSYIEILFYEKMYEEILKLSIHSIFDHDYIVDYLEIKFEGVLYSKIRKEVLKLVKISTSMHAYESLAITMDYIMKLKDGAKKRVEFEKELFDIYPEKKAFKKVLSYI